MRLVKLPWPFSGAGLATPRQEAPIEPSNGDGQRSLTEKHVSGPSTWLHKHKLVWLVIIALTAGLLVFGPAASFLLTNLGGGAAVNAALAFLFVVLLWLMKRHYEIIDVQREEFFSRAQHLEKSFGAIVPVLRTAVDLRDPATAEHAARLSELTAVLTRELGLGQQELHDITQAATLHDVGKLGVAQALLYKAGPLCDEEWSELMEHPTMGYKILEHVDFLQGFLEGAAEIIYAHHERHDGTGYPRGLAGEKIPMTARIFALVDAYDAITSHRPYRDTRSHQQAVEEIERNAGTQFDPMVVEAFLKANELGLIRRTNHERLEG